VRASEGTLGVLLATRHLVPVVDPDLHAADPERGLGLGGTEVDLGAQGVQGHAALAVPLTAAHLGASEAPGHGDPDAQGTRTHGGLHATAHRATEGHAAGELLGDALGQQRGVRLRSRFTRGLVHVLDLHVDALLRVALDVLAQAIDLGALAADHDAGPGRADEHPDLVALALDVDRADAGAREPGADVLAHPDVLVQLVA
jgi:hypothetical protein